MVRQKKKFRGVVVRLDERRGSRERRDDCPAGLWFIVLVTLVPLIWRLPW